MPLSRVLFVSDLHLAGERPDTTARFRRFFREVVPGATALYILGDLFEAWPGDDALGLPFESEVAAILRAASADRPLFFLHGNRDFIAGESFARATGATMLPDPSVIDLHGRRAVLLHGDTLCTDDVAYQAFRAQVRDPAWQAAILARPLAERIALTRGLRAGSQAAKQTKTEAIMDVNDGAVARAFADAACDLMIHGHTHRPARHEHVVDGRRCERWVLPDWYESGGYLAATPGGLEAVPLA